MEVGDIDIFGEEDLKDLEHEAKDSSWSSYWSLARKAYDDAVNSIVRPPRYLYIDKDLMPSAPVSDSVNLKRKDLQIYNSRGERLQCSWWWHSETSKVVNNNGEDGVVEEEEMPPCSRPAVLYLHCNTRSRVAALEVLPELIEAGFTVFAPDFSGCGRSEGRYVGLGVWENVDVAAAVERLRVHGVTHIGLWGHSMGAVAALKYVSKDHNSQLQRPDDQSDEPVWVTCSGGSAEQTDSDQLDKSDEAHIAQLIRAHESKKEQETDCTNGEEYNVSDDWQRVPSSTNGEQMEEAKELAAMMKKGMCIGNESFPGCAALAWLVDAGRCASMPEGLALAARLRALGLLRPAAAAAAPADAAAAAAGFQEQFLMGEWFFQEEEEGCGRVHYDFKIFAMVLDSPLNSVKDIVRDLIKSMNSQGVRIPSVMLSAANKAIKTMAWKRAKLDLAKLNPTAAAEQTRVPALYCGGDSDLYVRQQLTWRLASRHGRGGSGGHSAAAAAVVGRLPFAGDHYSPRPAAFKAAAAGWLAVRAAASPGAPLLLPPRAAAAAAAALAHGRAAAPPPLSLPPVGPPDLVGQAPPPPLPPPLPPRGQPDPAVPSMSPGSAGNAANTSETSQALCAPPTDLSMDRSNRSPSGGAGLILDVMPPEHPRSCSPLSKLRECCHCRPLKAPLRQRAVTAPLTPSQRRGDVACPWDSDDMHQGAGRGTEDEAKQQKQQRQRQRRASWSGEALPPRRENGASGTSLGAGCPVPPDEQGAG